MQRSNLPEGHLLNIAANSPKRVRTYLSGRNRTYSLWAHIRQWGSRKPPAQICSLTSERFAVSLSVEGAILWSVELPLAEDIESLAKRFQRCSFFCIFILLYRKESSDTATQDNPVNATAISDDYAAKREQLKEIYNNRTSKRTRGFITDVATMLN